MQARANVCCCCIFVLLSFSFPHPSRVSLTTITTDHTIGRHAQNMLYTEIVFAFIWQRVILDEAVDWTSILGAVIIIGFNASATILKGRDMKAAKQREMDAKRAQNLDDPAAGEGL